MSGSDQKKIAIVHFNLGGPDNLDAVQPFLFNLFKDPAIIQLPNPLRWLVAKLISTRRAPFTQEIYSHIGNKSPLLEETQAQCDALDALLNKDQKAAEYKSFIAMRYWHPFSYEAVEAVKAWGADEIILLPLYPQFSTTTTDSSIKDWHKEAKKAGLSLPTRTVGCYPASKNFIASHVEKALPFMKQALEKGKTRLLLSAHGLPQKVVDAGDPYEWQVKLGADNIVAGLKDKLGQDFDWTVCFQSKVGPLKWLEPSTEHELERAGQDNVNVVLIPIAFVSEHSETLVELDIEYKELADEAGVPHYGRVPTLTTDGRFIQSLVDEISKTNEGWKSEAPCPQNFGKCYCRANGLV